MLTPRGRQTGDMSSLPETDVARVQRWCRARVPAHVRDQVRVEADVAERHVTIVECRPPWRADVGAEWTRFPIARLRYTKSTGMWSLYWRDRNLRFHGYDRVPPAASVDELLSEVDRDPTAIFWGDGCRRRQSRRLLRGRRRDRSGEQISWPGPAMALAGSIVHLVSNPLEFGGGAPLRYSIVGRAERASGSSRWSDGRG